VPVIFKMALRGMRLNTYKHNFKLRVDLICNNVKEAIEVSNLLKEHNFKVRRTYVYYKPDALKKSEHRLVFIMDRLKHRQEPISMGKFLRCVYAPSQSVHIETYTKDLGVLILRGKIKAWLKGNKVMMEYNPEAEPIF